jgi:hypothetical protein
VAVVAISIIAMLAPMKHETANPETPARSAKVA